MRKKCRSSVLVALMMVFALVLSGCSGIYGGMLGAVVDATKKKDDASCFDPGGPSGKGTMTGNTNLERAYTYLVSAGYTKEMAAGIVGNLQTESMGAQPALAEIGYPNGWGWDKHGKQLRGWGIVQWTYSRHENVREYVASKIGKQYYTSQYSSPKADDWMKPEDTSKLLEVQLEYLLKEMQEGYKANVYDPMMKATTPEEAADIFVRKFEIPADLDNTSRVRQKQAREFYDHYAKGGATPTPGEAPGGGGGKTPSTGGPSTLYLTAVQKFPANPPVQPTPDDPGGGTSASSLTWHYPMDQGVRMTSPYGMRVHPVTGQYKLHTGIDLSGGPSDNLYAVTDGTVTFAENVKGYGNFVIIKLANGDYARYAHLSAFKVKAGDQVKVGQIIGIEGSTGYSTGNHLHFEIIPKENINDPVMGNRDGSKTIDPAPWLDAHGFNLDGSPNGKAPTDTRVADGGDSNLNGTCAPGGSDGGAGANGGIVVKNGKIVNGGFVGEVCAVNCIKVDGKKVTAPNVEWAGDWKGQTIEAQSEQAAYALAMAFSYIGMQYSWGGGNGAGPTKGCGAGCATARSLKFGDPNREGFDCSGLVGFSWYQAGGTIQITDNTRTTVAQMVAGRVGGVRKSEGQEVPGDVINTGFGNWHHTALYVGQINGKKYWVEAPRSGEFIRIAPTRENGGWEVHSFLSEGGKVVEKGAAPAAK